MLSKGKAMLGIAKAKQGKAMQSKGETKQDRRARRAKMKNKRKPLSLRKLAIEEFLGRQEDGTFKEY